MTHFVHMRADLGPDTAFGDRRMGTPRGARQRGGDHRPRAPGYVAARLGDRGTSFGQRRTLPELDALPPVSGDSGVYVSEDRDRG